MFSSLQLHLCCPLIDFAWLYLFYMFIFVDGSMLLNWLHSFPICYFFYFILTWTSFLILFSIISWRLCYIFPLLAKQLPFRVEHKLLELFFFSNEFKSTFVELSVKQDAWLCLQVLHLLTMARCLLHVTFPLLSSPWWGCLADLTTWMPLLTTNSSLYPLLFLLLSMLMFDNIPAVALTLRKTRIAYACHS